MKDDSSDVYKVINRSALILEPTPEFLAWMKAMPGDPFEMTYDDFKEDVSVYLLPDELNNPESWLRRNFKPILEQELFNWCTDDSLWPPHLDYKTFKSFFKQRFCLMVVDLCDGDIQSESFQD